MSQIEVSPGGVGFIRTPITSVPGVPASAKRQKWVDGSSVAQSAANGEVKRGRRGSVRRAG